MASRGFRIVFGRPDSLVGVVPYPNSNFRMQLSSSQSTLTNPSASNLLALYDAQHLKVSPTVLSQTYCSRFNRVLPGAKGSALLHTSEHLG